MLINVLFKGLVCFRDGLGIRFVILLMKVGDWMKDLPFFTTENGIAALGLKQIPYNGYGYITIHDSMQPQQLLQECCDFCKAVGAEKICATGHAFLQEFPLHTIVNLMRCPRELFAHTEAVAQPVQTTSLELFRELYNGAMKTVQNASYMSPADAEQILSKGKGYFIYRDDVLLGIGVAGDSRIDAIISLVKGCGEIVLLALNQVLCGEYVEVEVASTNTRAMKLYNRMGFRIVHELSRWYKIF